MTHYPTLLGTAVLGLALLTGCEAEPEASLDAYESTTEYAADAAAPASPLTDQESFEAEVSDAASDLSLAPTTTAPSAASAITPPAAELGRHLRRSADLRVSTDDYDQTLRQARALAPRFGGLVTGEDGSSYGDDLAQTTLTLRVPSDRFDAALDALAALGDVDSRAVTVDDVTGQVVDVEARLRAKKAAEARYVTFVSQAGSVTEMLEVQRQLDGVRAEIEAMESQVRSLRSAVALSTIRATIVGPARVAPAPVVGVGAQVAEALAAGWHGVLAVVIGVLPLWPLVVMGGLGFAVWRRLQQRVAI